MQRYIILLWISPISYSLLFPSFSAHLPLPLQIDKYLKNEVALLKDMSHPNLLLFIGVTDYQKHYYIVTEYLPAGDLRRLLSDKTSPLGWKLRLNIARGIIDGIGYLHDNDIIHRDIKVRHSGGCCLSWRLSCRLRMY